MGAEYAVGEMPEKLRSEVIAVLAGYERARIVKACAQIRQAAKAGSERKFIADEAGNGGEVTMQIHPTSFHNWGQKLGYQCWEDKQFCAEYLRDNPAARVKSRNAKPNVGWRQVKVGGQIVAGGSGVKRFRKISTRIISERAKTIIKF